jgi:FliI/YscN family ATPase
LEQEQTNPKCKIDQVFETGIKAVDGFLTLGRGQRIAIFSEPGVGKTSLLSSLVKNSDADVNVIALIGERSREIREFIEDSLDSETRARSVLVASTSSESAVSRTNAALIATAIAEYFCEQGKNVLLTFDSLTRLFRAYREVGLARGEIPIRNGYPPSAYESLPKLIERAGNTPKGSITAIYSVLLSGSLEEDPMVEEVKGLTDGHIILDRKIAEQGQYPAVNVLKSLSRLQNNLVSKEHLNAVRELRKFKTEFESKKDLMFLSEARSEQFEQYESLDSQLSEFLSQESGAKYSYSETLDYLENLAGSLF